LIASSKYSCFNEILTITSMLSVPNCFVRPVYAKREADLAKGHFANSSSDHLTLLNVFHAFKSNNEESQWCYEMYINYRALKEAVNVRKQLFQIAKRSRILMINKNPNNEANVRKALIEGFFAQVACLDADKKLITNDDELVKIHPSSSLTFKSEPEWLIFNEVVVTTNTFIRTVTAIEPAWLIDVATHYYDMDQKQTSCIGRALNRFCKVNTD